MTRNIFVVAFFSIFMSITLGSCGVQKEAPHWAPMPRLQWDNRSYLVYQEDIPIGELEIAPSELMHIGITVKPDNGISGHQDGEITCGCAGWPILQDQKGNLYLKVEEGIYWRTKLLPKASEP